MNLMQLIEQTRQRMYDAAKEYGLSSEETTKVSEELDKLLNRLQREGNIQIEDK